MEYQEDQRLHQLANRPSAIGANCWMAVLGRKSPVALHWSFSCPNAIVVWNIRISAFCDLHHCPLPKMPWIPPSAAAAAAICRRVCRVRLY